MKLLHYLLIILILTSCKKGDNYCNPPKELNGFVSDNTFHNPYLPVEVQLDYPDLYGNDNDEIFFEFEVPPTFVRDKGEQYASDISKTGFYSYTLKDADNPPYSVEVKARVFNDCGRSEWVSSVIYFDTVQ